MASSRATSGKPVTRGRSSAFASSSMMMKRNNATIAPGKTRSSRNAGGEAWSATNTPATPTSESSRHIAAFTAFLFTTTSTAVTTVKMAKRLKRIEPIGSVPLVAVLLGGFLFVPLEVLVRQRAAELIEPVLVVDHLLAGVAGHRILLLQEDRLLRADLLAHAAVNAAQHVDFEFLRRAFDVRVVRTGWNLPRRNPDRLRG